MYVFVSVWISITRLWLADIRRSVLHLYNSRNGLFVFGYPVLKTLGNNAVTCVQGIGVFATPPQTSDAK